MTPSAQSVPRSRQCVFACMLTVCSAFMLLHILGAGYECAASELECRSCEVSGPHNNMLSSNYVSFTTDVPDGFFMELSHTFKKGSIPPKFKQSGDYVEISARVYDTQNSDDQIRRARIVVEGIRENKKTGELGGRKRFNCKRDKNSPNEVSCKAYIPGDRRNNGMIYDSEYYFEVLTRNKPEKRKLTLSSPRKKFYTCDDNGQELSNQTCSDVQPFYCDKGRVVENPPVCGCPEGYNLEGNKCVVEEIPLYPIVPLVVNGPKNQKLDVLFLKDRYGDNHEKFEQDVQTSIDTLFEIEPYTSNDFRFNIYMAEDNPSLGCQEGGNQGIYCDMGAIENFLNYHNLDKAIVLVNDFENRGSASPTIAMSSVLGSRYTVPHEFTHTLNIRDEYGYAGNYDGPPPHPDWYRNCSPTLEHCEDLELEFPGQVRCRDGCFHNNWYRMVPQSLMGCSRHGEEYLECRTLSPLSEKLVREELEKYE